MSRNLAVLETVPVAGDILERLINEENEGEMGVLAVHHHCCRHVA